MTTNSNLRVKNSLEFTTSGEGIIFADSTVMTTAAAGAEIPLIAAAETTATTTATGKLVSISDNGGRLAYYNNTVTDWLYVFNDSVVYTPPAPPPPSGPPVTDYIAWYDVDSYIGTVWYDKSVNGSNASSAGVSIASVSGFGASALTSAIDGSSGSGSIEFPVNILNQDGYTLFHVTRRIAGNSGRIMTALSSDNWFSGHWQNTAGTCFHNGWLTGSSDYYADNWLINVDQQYFYRPNGNVSLEGSGGGGLIPATIGISISSTEPCAGWQAVEVIIYDRELNSTEISDTETYLATRYGITLGV